MGSGAGDFTSPGAGGPINPGGRTTGFVGVGSVGAGVGVTTSPGAGGPMNPGGRTTGVGSGEGTGVGVTISPGAGGPMKPGGKVTGGGVSSGGGGSIRRDGSGVVGMMLAIRTLLLLLGCDRFIRLEASFYGILDLFPE